MNLRVLTLIAAFAALLCAPAVHAQLELAAPKRFNPLHSEGAAYGVTAPETPGQFSSAGVTSGGTAPGAAGLYRDGQSQVIPGATLQLRRARIGNAFATGVPRYYLGDEITPPLADADNNPAPDFYWRRMPVRPGESFVNSSGGNLTDALGVQMPNTSGSSGTPLPALTTGGYESFYYSPHADRVFASQAGAVEIWWVSAAQINGSWKFRNENFNVSGATSVPVRKIYWTEKAFDGPRVTIPSGRIELANPIYNAKFPPMVTEEYVQLGYVENPDPAAQPAGERRTLWYEKLNGNGQLSAYNLEGRLLVEYLGPETSPGKHEFLGADVVEVVKATRSQTNQIELGQQVRPRKPAEPLVAAPVLNLSAVSQAPYYATKALASGELVYYAERENLNPDLVLFYWLENSDIAIDLLPEGESSGVNIAWPKYKDRYTFVWPADLSSYAYVTTDPTGSDAATGLEFPSTSLPQIIFQDDPSQTEASFDAETQRLVVALGGDEYNRTLLKFVNGQNVWYQVVYTQTENRAAYVQPDQGEALVSTATVGSRITRPSSAYSLAGAISKGTGYHPAAYLDPYTVGVEAAESGAIIPVNAVPGNREMKVRWFQKIEPPADLAKAFTGFYVASKVGTYTVSYPEPMGDWQTQAAMSAGRSNHGASLLENGQVLVVGGTNAADQAIASAELYDPETARWETTESLSVARRSGFTTTRLNSGKVLVTGGFIGNGDSSDGGTASVEVYDPASGNWTTLSAMSEARVMHQATLLVDGRVLVCGGQQWDGGEQMGSSSAELYDPATDSWSVVNSMNMSRYSHTATLLGDGRVLVAGGSWMPGENLAMAELYDPATGLWLECPDMSQPREGHSATLLEDGRVLVVGMDTNNWMAGSAEIYEPALNEWLPTGVPLASHYFHRASLLLNGKVLVSGGSNNPLVSSEIFDPASGLWRAAATLNTERDDHAATVLDSGQVLLTGGRTLGSLATATVEVSEQSDTVVMASNLGTSGLTAAQAAGELYVQNDPAATGFNPNEEHAVKKDSKFWALRDDLNMTQGGGAVYTSEPFMLVAYTDPEDGRPAMRTFRVLRESHEFKFEYSWTAGSKLQGPLPLPLMQLPLRNGSIANTEVSGVAEATLADASAPTSYGSFTFQDRQGYKWLYRGPHAGGAPTLGMQWYYPMTAGFYFPQSAAPALGSALPFLRPLDPDGVPLGDAVNGTALTVNYTPLWPESVPVLHLAETLTLAKYGLPDVRNQKSAEILYQQSIAKNGSESSSVILHDPTRYKLIPLADTGLLKIPGSIRTSVYQGKTYFQGLPPHLQSRFFFDPLASSKGSLILKGEFYDEIAGDDYLDLNVLSSQDLADLKALAENEDNTVKSQWESGIDGLKTRIETFVENPVQRGSYIVSSNSSLTYDAGAGALANMPDADTARDSYALTANGRGEGYVTLMFANGRNPALTPVGDPPMMQIIRVVPELYNGDLKVRLSSNPLDEKVSLRHSGDFAAQPENYEFEWYHAPPTASGTQPPTYTYTNQTILGNSENPASREWRSIQAPASARPPLADYPSDLVSLPNQVVVNGPDADVSSSLPGIVFRANQPVDFSSGIPAKITFSASLEALDGFVLYVNGAVAVVHRNGVPALDGLLAENAYDLRLIRAGTVGDLPVEGESLVVVAEVAGVLHFRIFDAAGTQVIDTDESELAGKTTELTELRGRLSGLWATTNLLNSDKSTVVDSASSIVGFDLDQDASSGLSADGLQKQFAIGEGYFIKGPNTIEVALYSAADAGVLSNVDFRLEGSTRNDQVIASGSQWAKATGSPALDNRATVGGSPTAPLGSPLLVMSDNFFTVRYRAKEFLADGVTPNPAYTLTNGAWTNWTRPALVEGWIKRVLAAINPFNQRMTDLYNNAVNTDVSLLTQAGTRWEGDIALTLDAINDYGLIEIYETVLKRGKGISIGSGYDYGPANDALLLAAGYLSDLYSILGNEAFADAANPTVSLGDSGSASEVNTSRFCFEGQVASVLDEELALLRGRDDFLSPQTTQGPFYNRLFWNYTRGIDSGEALYATNYNIKEKVGSSTEDGSINAADAQRMFPQGHGDAYGHYLTALKGYYQLLINPNFTWTPRTESLNILGNTVAVDYRDERKFAEGAANIARTAEQVVSLTFRQQYRDDPADGWESFRDGKENPNTGNTRRWGLDAWTSRANQGAYYHWAVGNAMLPDVDEVHTGIQKIDRTTVPELQLLAVSGESFQTTLDNANAHLNPLGLSPGAVAFDIDPAKLKAGESHYEQVYDRSLGAVLNAKGAFDQAAIMTRLLRNQENTIDDFNTTLEEQERAFTYQLIDLYGSPYPGDVGPGKTYVQGYSGPDLNNWFVIDRPSPTLVTAKPVTITARVPANIPDFVDFSATDINQAVVNQTTLRTVVVEANPFGQFADQWMPGVDLGRRGVTGRLQQAMTRAQLAFMAVQEANARLQSGYLDFQRQGELLEETIDYHEENIAKRDAHNEIQGDLAFKVSASQSAAGVATSVAEALTTFSESVAEALPKAVGVATDATAPARSGIRVAAGIGAKISQGVAIAAEATAAYLENQIGENEGSYADEFEQRGYTHEEQQLAFEYEKALRKMLASYHEVAQLALKMQQASEEVRTVMAQGDRIQLEREIFRKRAATVVQGYRTNDLTFRAFRDESLEQYRTLFDLASRYTYLAAKSYDYETGLLGTPQGQAVISKIVSSRALGDLTGGQPQATVSTLGDSGLAGTMAQLNADFSVAEGRLGINNPDTNGTLISLRQELFRLRNDPTVTDDDKAWQQTLEQHMVVDLMNDPDVAAQCLNIRKPDGSPVAGMVIPFGSTIQHGKNFFGLPTAAGDHNFSPSNFATKIYSAGVVFDGYLGMDPYAEGVPGAGGPDTNSPNALNATPYVYLIPVGVDKMLAPPLGDTGIERSWRVQDQALPLPYNLGATAFSATQFFSADGTLTEQPWITRKHQAFRPVDDAAFFYGLQKSEFQSSRLVGRSVWNTQWKLVIPAYGLLNDEQAGLDRFAATVDDIKLFLRTYSHSGN